MTDRQYDLSKVLTIENADNKSVRLHTLLDGKALAVALSQFLLRSRIAALTLSPVGALDLG